MKTLFSTTWSSLCILPFIIAGWFINTESLAQNEVAIGSATTKSNAILWLNGNGSQGLILPTVTNKSAVASPDEGMIVYDNSDKKLWYRNNSAWVEVGGGSGGTGTFHLEVSGNLLRLLTAPGGTLLASTNIAGGTQTNGSFLIFESGAWRFATLSGDITGANGNLQLKGKAMANLPASTQVLAYDPTANSGNGGWVFQAVAGGGSVTNVTGTAPITVTNPTTTPLIGIAAAGITNALIANDAITTAKILDATITGADIANTTITANKLAQSGATDNQILQWNGTNWVPVTLAGGGSVANVATGTGLTGGPITTTGTISIAAGGVGNTEIANDAVTSAKIADATITGADIANTTITSNKLAQSAATPGQVLKWNGTNWIPENDDTGVGTTPTLNPGQILIGDGSINTAATLSGDATLAGGVLTIANNAITTAKINASAVDVTKLADNAVTSAKIADATITGADIANTTITANKLAQSGALNNQILQWNGTNWLPVTLAAGGSVTNVATGAGLTGGPITTTGTIEIATSGVVTTMLADNAVTDGKIAAGVSPAKLTSGVNGQVLTTVGGVPVWQNAATGFTNPMTNVGDVITGGTGGAAQRVGVGTNGQVLTVTAGTPTWQTPVVAGTAGGDLTGTYPNPTVAAGAITNVKLAANAVQTTNITDGAVTDAKIGNVAPAKILQAGATAGQVLKWSGSQWEPAPDNIGGGGVPTLQLGEILVGDGTSNTQVTVSQDATLNSTNGNITVQGFRGRTISAAVPATNSVYQYNGAQWEPVVLAGGGTVSQVNTGTGLTGGPITATGTIAIADGGVGATQLADNAVTSAKIADATITGADIAALTITSTNIVDNSVTAAKLAQSGASNNQVLQWNGSNWLPVTLAAGGSVTNVATGAGLTGGPITTTGTLAIATSGVDNTMLADNAVTSAKIADGTIVNADIGGAAAIAGSKVVPAFGAQNISTTGTLSSGATTVTGLTVTGTTTTVNTVPYTWPAAQGAASTVLTNNGTGTLTWAAAGGSGWGLTGNAGTNPATNFLGTTDAQPLRFATGAGGVERMRILATGNVGIGTVTPGAKLNIHEPNIAATAPTVLTLTGASTGGGSIGMEFSSTNGSAETNTAAITLKNFTANDKSLQFLNANPNAISTTRIFRFLDNTTAPVLTMLNSGNVGIGTEDPVAKLDILGNIKITDGTQAAGSVLTSDANGLASWQPAGGAGFSTLNTVPKGDGSTLVASQIFDDGTNVGIGTLAPEAKLDVAGYLRLAVGAGIANEGLLLASPAPGFALIRAGGRATTEFRIDQNNNAPITIRTNNIERMRISGDGSVAIGTSTPSNFLHVAGDVGGSTTIATLEGHSATATRGPGISLLRSKGTVAAPVAVVNGDYLGGFSVSGRTASAYNLSSAIQFNVDGAVAGTSVPGRITFSTTLLGSGSPTERMRITNTGNVGIGTTTPAARLDIVGGPIKITDGTQAAGRVLTSDATGLASWTTPSGSTLITNPGLRNLFAGSPIGTTTTGEDNAFYGSGAGDANAAGSYNVFMGSGAGTANTSGGLNTLIGWRAGVAAATNNGNTFIGAQAGESTTENINTFIGEKAGQLNTTGSENVFMGNRAGITNTNGGRNTIIGNNANVGAAGLQNATAIGYRAFVNQSNSLVLGSIAGVNGAASSTNVGIGTTTPTARLSLVGDIQQMLDISSSASNTLMYLNNTGTNPADWFFGYLGNTGVNPGFMTMLRGGVHRFVVTNNGNVGIGTTTPANGLTVAAGTSIGGGYTASAAPADGLIVQGNVGIGNTNPGVEAGAGRYLTVATGTSVTNSLASLELQGGQGVIGQTVGRLDFISNSAVGNSAIGRISAITANGAQFNGALIFQTRSGTPFASSALTEAMRVTSGRVGMGTIPSVGRLDVSSESSTTLNLNVNAVSAITAYSLVRFTRNNGLTGNISESNGVVSYNAFTGSHYAKVDESITYGELATLTGNNNILNKQSEEMIYGIAPSSIENDPKLLGSYLSPLGDPDHADVHQVMAVGNGEVWVIHTGQDLEAGDYLISSSVRGHAMQEDGNHDIAYVFARVAAPVRWADVTETINGVKHTKVSVFYESFIKNNKADKLEKEIATMKADIEYLKQLMGAQASKKD